MSHFASPASGSSALVPWESPADPAWRDLLTDIVEPVKEANPFLVWMTGKLPTSDRQMPVGWHVHRGVNPHLDALLERLRYQHHLIEHQNEQSNETELVDYWALNYRWDDAQSAFVLVPCSLFVLARGVPDKREMRDPTDRYGVAYGWEVNRQRDGSVVLKENGEPKKTARLKLRAFIHELLPVPGQAWEKANGFLQWFQVSISGYLVDDMLGVLYSQYRAMRAYTSRLAPQDDAFKTPYWGLSNPTVAASAPRRVGTREGQSTTIVPMRSLIPATEADIPDEFLLRHRIPPALEREIGELLLETWDWSLQETRYIEGLELRPTGNSSLPGATAVPGVVVSEEPPAQASSSLTNVPPSSAPEPRIDAAQQQALAALLAYDEARIQALCQQYRINELSELTVTQFQHVLQGFSQPR